MTTIKNFFENLNNQIKEAKSIKALNILEKRGRKFTESIKNPLISKTIQKQAMAKFRSTQKLIRKIKKKLKA